MADEITEFKKSLAANKLIFGTEETMKKLKYGKITKIYLSSNCDQMTKSEMRNICTLTNVSCIDLLQTNEEIGVICKKPFAISVVGAV